MDCSAHYRDQADHARQLADAAWQLDLRDMLRRIAKDLDQAAETGTATGEGEIHYQPQDG